MSLVEARRLVTSVEDHQIVIPGIAQTGMTRDPAYLPHIRWTASSATCSNQLGQKLILVLGVRFVLVAATPETASTSSLRHNGRLADAARGMRT